MHSGIHMVTQCLAEQFVIGTGWQTRPPLHVMFYNRIHAVLRKQRDPYIFLLFRSSFCSSRHLQQSSAKSAHYTRRCAYLTVRNAHAIIYSDNRCIQYGLQKINKT